MYFHRLGLHDLGASGGRAEPLLAMASRSSSSSTSCPRLPSAEKRASLKVGRGLGLVGDDLNHWSSGRFHRLDPGPGLALSSAGVSWSGLLAIDRASDLSRPAGHERPAGVAVYGKEAQTRTPPPRKAPSWSRSSRMKPSGRPRLSHRQPDQAPPHFNEATLLSGDGRRGQARRGRRTPRGHARKGLGTPATRAQVIEGLIYENTSCVRAAT